MNFASSLQDITYSPKEGLVVSCLPVERATFVHLTLTLRGGAGQEAEGEFGYFSLLGTLLGRGCGKLSRAEFAEDCDRRGANVNIYPGRDYLTIEIWILPNDLEWALQTLINMVWSPQLAPEEIEAAQEESIAQLLARKDEKRSYLFDQARQSLFPVNHHYSRPLLGTQECLENADQVSLTDFHRKVTGRVSAVICLTGRFDCGRVEKLIENSFFAFQYSPQAVPPKPVPFNQEKERSLRLEFPVDQAEVLIALPAPARTDSDYRLATFCNEILGGAFLSRLTRAVRMQEGLAYSADSRLRSGTEIGSLWIGLQTDVRNLELALQTVRGCMSELLKKGVGETEFLHFKEFVSSSMLFDYDALASLTSRRLEEVLFGEPWRLESRLEQFEQEVNRSSVQEMFERLLQPEKALVCLLGQDLPKDISAAFFREPKADAVVAPPLSLSPGPKAGSGRGQPQLIQEHPQGQLFRLSSGHHLLTLPRPGLGSISLQVWSVTGSMDEKRGRTGLSHLLEHLMFRGTDRFPDGSFDAILAQKGGLNNAFTSEDFTVYTDYVTLDGLEEALCLEADRFEALKISRELFLTERSVVLEERSVRVDCNPLGKAYERLQALAFPDHPYGHPVIGWREDLEATRLEDLQAHYELASDPGRVLIVIAGGCPTERALELTERCFGESGRSVTQPVWPVVCPTDSVPKLGRRSEHMAERSGYSYLLLCYRFPREGHPDYEACELLSRVIADGDSCRLYDKFVREEKKFLEVWTSYESQARDHPLLHLGMAVAGEERRPQDSAAEVIDFLHRLSTSLTAEELEKVRVSWMAEEAFGTDELEDWSLEIAGRVVLMPWEKVWQQSQRIEAVTLQDLKRVADLYLSKDNCVSLTLEGQSG